MTRTTSTSCLRSPDPCSRSWHKHLWSLTPLTKSPRSACPLQSSLFLPLPSLPFCSLPSLLQVVDQYLNFVTLTNKLFSFNQQDVYLTLNNPKATDTDIEALVEKIASSLFSVVLTLGNFPTFLCSVRQSRTIDHFLESLSAFFQVKSRSFAAREGMRLNLWHRSWTRRSGSTSPAQEPTCFRKWIQ